MANFVITLHTPPSDTDTAHALFRFAHSALELGHTISNIFLFQDGIYHGLRSYDLASDDFDLDQQWQKLHAKGVNLNLCVTAANKRAVSSLDEDALFTISGLAEFAMDASQADKWVQFK